MSIRIITVIVLYTSHVGWAASYSCNESSALLVADHVSPKAEAPTEINIRTMVASLDREALGPKFEQTREVLLALEEYDKSPEQAGKPSYALPAVINVLGVASRNKNAKAHSAQYWALATRIAKEQGPEKLKETLLTLKDRPTYAEASSLGEGLKLLGQITPVGSRMATETAQDIIRHLSSKNSFDVNERLLKSAAQAILSKDPDDTTSVLVAMAQLTCDDCHLPEGAIRFNTDVIDPVQRSKFLDMLTEPIAGMPLNTLHKPKVSDISLADRYLTALYRRELKLYDKFKSDPAAFSLAHSHLKLAHEAARARRKYFQGLKNLGIEWTVEVVDKNGKPVQKDIVDLYRKREESLLAQYQAEDQRLMLAHYQPAQPGGQAPRPTTTGNIIAGIRKFFRYTNAEAR